MKWGLIFLPLLFSSCSMAGRKPAGGVNASIPLPPGYHMVWHDEFTGNTLDDTRWKPLIRVRGDARDNFASIRVSNGLHITTYTEASQHYTGFLSTQGIFQTAYGYFEASIDFHDSPGEWCAFWLQSPTNGKPIGDPEHAGMEIDVTEHRASDREENSLVDSSAIGALHWDGYGPSHKDVWSTMAAPPDGKSPQGNFHTYGVLWTADGYDFYIDGSHIVSHLASSNPVSQAREFIYLSCEVRNKSWAGVIPTGGYGDLASSHTGMDVAWVRVWKPTRSPPRESEHRE